MKILVTPKDLIERCVWYEYEFYILKDMPLEERKRIIRENKEFEISERDAFVIGLTKVIYTDNLNHKFNEYVESILKNKSFEHSVNDTRKFINKNLIISEVSKFMNKFPSAYEPNAHWKAQIETTSQYVENIKEKIAKLPITVVQEYEMVSSISVQRLLEHL